MQSELGNGSSQDGPHDPVENSSFETMVRVEHDLRDVIDALALLGIKRCSQCRQFFRSADPGALFDCEQHRLLQVHPRLVVFLLEYGSVSPIENGLRGNWHRGCESITTPKS